MSVYLVIFNINDEKRLNEAIGKLKFLSDGNCWARLNDNSWFIGKNNSSTSEIRDKFKRELETQDEVFVVQIDGTYLSWNFTKDRQSVTAWLKAMLN